MTPPLFIIVHRARDGRPMMVNAYMITTMSDTDNDHILSVAHDGDFWIKESWAEVERMIYELYRQV